MKLDKRNIKLNYKKRFLKRILILCSIIAIPVITIICIFYTMGGKERFDEKDYAQSLYQNVFVDKKKIDSIDKMTPDAAKQINEIYSMFNTSPKDEQPIYSKNTIFRFVNVKGLTSYQFEDKSFKAGTGLFAKWKNVIIFIFNSNHILKEVQHKDK